MTKILKFATVGVLNTLINYIIYCVLCYVGVNYQVALFIAYMIAMVNSFLMNKVWTFEDKEKSDGMQISKFIAVNLFSCLLNAVFLEIFVRVGLNIYLAQAVATGIVLFCNFILYNSFIFNRKNSNNSI